MIDDTTKQRIKELLISGMKAKAIVSEMGGGVSVDDVYALTFQMRKSGELKKPAAGTKPDKPSVAPKKKGKKEADEFQTVLAGEIKFVEGEIERLQTLADAYDKTNSGFAEHVEKKIQRETRKLALLREYQKN